ncbi:MAG: GGDEF domain-containing protein [Magnetococcales bacterium]|nr:GGDEF domain-containing protein [Magnetococcales bacterium]
MASLVPRLEELLTLLEGGKPRELAQGKALVESLLADAPCRKEVQGARKNVAGLISGLLKSALERQRGGAAKLQGLTRALVDDAAWEDGTISRKIQLLIPLLAPAKAGSAREAASIQAELPERVQGLLQLLLERSLAPGELPPDSKKLARADFWQEADRQLTALCAAAPLPPSSREFKKAAIKKTVLQLAHGLDTLLQELGRQDKNITATLAGLRKKQASGDLNLLAKTLLRECGLFQSHARSLRERSATVQDQIRRLEVRLEEMEEALDETRRDHHRDPSTGIPDRFAFSAHFERNRERADHLGELFVVLLVHLENHSALIDKIGRKGERKLFSALSARLGELLPDEALLTRLSGDRFGILLPKCHLEQLAPVGERIRRMLQGTRFRFDGHSIEVRGLLGAAAFEPEMTEEFLLSLADRGVLLARQLEGREVGVVAPPSQSDKGAQQPVEKAEKTEKGEKAPDDGGESPDKSPEMKTPPQADSADPDDATADGGHGSPETNPSDDDGWRL